MGVEELCSVPVINLMSAVFTFALESTRKTCWRVLVPVHAAHGYSLKSRAGSFGGWQSVVHRSLG